MKTIIIIILLILAVGLKAQQKRLTYGLSLTSELQYDFQAKTNWVNLAALGMEYTPWRNGAFELQTISTYKTSDRPIADDFQTFSNIEEDNMALNIFLAGYTHDMGRVSLFGGIRNVNNDFFIATYTSLFTNSSCGIYPTISANYPLANYPLSGVCLHAEVVVAPSLRLKSSLYNGVSRQLFNHQKRTIFAVDPRRDGVFSMSELGYTDPDRYACYTVGATFHSRYKEGGSRNVPSAYSVWASVEQSIYRSDGRQVGVLGQASFAPSGRSLCSRYYGLGAVCRGFLSQKHDNDIGVLANYAVFGGRSETFIELTGRYGVTSGFSVQPVFDFIMTAGHPKTIGMIRLNYTL